MANTNIKPVSNHDKPDRSMGKTIPLTPGGVIGGGSTWEPECETSFGGKLSQPDPKKCRLKSSIESYLKAWAKSQMHFISANSKM